jgi:hypothetical protein
MEYPLPNQILVLINDEWGIVALFVINVVSKLVKKNLFFLIYRKKIIIL